jgi:hypothetical protein
MNHFWPGKKITAFIALKHHTRFITPITEHLAKKGAQILYVIGQGENPQELTAMELGLEYRHVFDYVGPKDKGDVHQNYLLQKEALARSLRMGFALATHPATITDRALLSTAREYVGFRNMVREERPDLCIALHELNRWGKMLGFWAKKEGVPFITLQEGLYYGHDIGVLGHVQFTTLNLLWGETTRRKLSQFEAPLDRIIPVGNTHLAHEIERLEADKVREQMRKRHGCDSAVAVLLFIPPTPPSADKFMPLFDYFAKTKEKRLFLKWHPTAMKSLILQWEKGLPEPILKGITRIHGEESAYDLMAMSDLCILTVPSTTGLEALAMGKPLVQLTFEKESKSPYSFVEKHVAIPMTPSGLAEALKAETRFADLMDARAVADYLKGELHETEGVVERIEGIARDLIRARQGKPLPPLAPATRPDMDWTLVLPVVGDPRALLFQLQAVAENTGGQGTYEVILLEAEGMDREVLEILESLGGDVRRMKIPAGIPLPEFMNRAALQARGETIIFFGPDGAVAPKGSWLSHLSRAVARHGTKKLFGARIENPYGNLLHAGVILNPNHAPVSAYGHLASDFPNAQKERAFQLLDRFLALDRGFFLELGGFQPESGRYAFMDLCLRAGEGARDPEVALYIPEVNLVQPLEDSASVDPSGAAYFYGRWHGTLWDSEDRFYEGDGISNAEVRVALMKRLVELTKARQDA